MKCPFCNNYFTVVEDSRETKDGTKVKRKRKCTLCENKFITYEMTASEIEKLEVHSENI